jgi:hypothetical protein
MLKCLLPLIVCSIVAIGTVQAQKVLEATETIKEMKSDSADGWHKIGGIGLDFSTLSLINPRSGSGDNRFGFGGLLNYNANLKQGKIIWDNKFNLQASVVKVGSDPYTKANDVLQVTSQFGYAIASKWYVAALGDLQTQFLPTYGKNFLTSNPNGTVLPVSSGFFAPAIVRFAPGVIYKPNNNFKVLFSPVALKAVIVNDDDVARAGTWGNEVIKNAAGVVTSFKNTDLQLGAEVRADYSKKFFNDRLIYAGTLDLYSNYLRNPENIAVEFYNSFDLVLFKNISLNFKSDWFYDNNIAVTKTRDVPGLSQPQSYQSVGWFGRNALFIKYNRLF